MTTNYVEQDHTLRNWSIIGCILVSVCIIFLIMVAYDEQQKAENIVNGLSCDFMKKVVIDINENLFFKSPLYDPAIKKWDSQECEDFKQ